MFRRDLAICTRALSSGAYFDLWYRYYSKQVGPENLFVISISPNEAEFDSYELGGLLKLQSYPYDERQKARVFQHMLGLLLQTHRFVLICDVDEIIVPEPGKYEGLLDFIEKDGRPYFSCIGFNVLHYKDEAPLELGRPIVGEQRSYARFASPMCKTCFTSIDFKVPATFHYVGLHPSFGDLFHVPPEACGHGDRAAVGERYSTHRVRGPDEKRAPQQDREEGSAVQGCQ